ncbi:MAG: Asp23/Gls24 family envelope stress response protein [Synergistaceae bacterium]|nr:Asp23/Gls24 family envelope stress response protein [Synergistaceae bacterium]
MDNIRADEKNTLGEGNVPHRGVQFEGNVRIADDVIIELAKKTISGISNIQLASMGLVSKFGIGRKSGDGIRVLSVEDGKIPATTVDVYIRIKYGYRIPDLVWDVQEKVKTDLERYTGYTVTAVNVNVQGIYADDSKDAHDEAPEEERDATPDEE